MKYFLSAFALITLGSSFANANMNEMNMRHRHHSRASCQATFATWSEASSACGGGANVMRLKDFQAGMSGYACRCGFDPSAPGDASNQFPWWPF